MLRALQIGLAACALAAFLAPAAKAQSPGQTRTITEDQGDRTVVQGREVVFHHQWRTRTERYEKIGTQQVEGTKSVQVWVPDEPISELLGWDGAPVRLNGKPIDGHKPIRGLGASGYWYWEAGSVDYAHTIDFNAINEALGHPSYFTRVIYFDWRANGDPTRQDYSANKLGWVATYDRVHGSGDSAYISTVDAPNTTSSLLEASRLAQIYLDLVNGETPPSATLDGYYMAFGDPHPYSIPFTADAVLAKLKEVFAIGIETNTPIALDLNHDGHIGVTGKSTAAVRKPGHEFVRKGSILFDLDGLGQKHRYEWLDGDGDGFLVYDRGGIATAAMRHGGYVDGKVLFGNAVGFDNGFQKLAALTSGAQVASTALADLKVPYRPAVTGTGLEDLKVWIDRNHDGRIQPGELHSLASLGITEVGLEPQLVTSPDGEIRVVSYFIQHGRRYMSEDVFFAEDPQTAYQRR